MTSGFLAMWQSLASSANLVILLTMLVSGSFIYLYMINASGPDTLSCGRQDVTGAQLLQIGLVDECPLVAW